MDIKNFKTGYVHITPRERGEGGRVHASLDSILITMCSFRDGHAFLALAHKYDPSQFNYDELNNVCRVAFSSFLFSFISLFYSIFSDLSYQLSNDQRLEKAFEIAEKTINIPKLLDVNEVMKGTADERALILYASLFFHAFSAQAQARAAAGKHTDLQDALSSAQQSKEELLKRVAELEQAKYVLLPSLPLILSPFLAALPLSNTQLTHSKRRIDNRQGIAQRRASQIERTGNDFPPHTHFLI